MKIISRLKKLFKIFSLVFLSSGISTAVFAQEEFSVELHFSSLKPQSATTILIGVYDEKREFLSDNVFRTVEIQTNGESSFVHQIHLPKGEYAMALFQDLNRDKTLNRNFIGYPLEPFAFSNNPSFRLGPPKWKSAVFKLHDNVIMKIEF